MTATGRLAGATWAAGARSCGRPASRPGRARRRRARRPAALRVRRAGHGSRIRSATSRRSSIGVDVPPVTPTMRRVREDRRVGQVADALDLDGRRAGDLAQAGQLLGVGARATADDDHQVDLAGRLEGVLLAADRDRADRVDDLELVGARDHEGGEPLELPGRLGGLRDERHPLAPRDGGLPLLLLVDDDRVGREAEQADDLGVLRRAEQDDGVALLDELAQLALLLDDPGAGAVDDLEAALLGALHDVRADAVGADDDGRAVVDVVERCRRSGCRAPGGRGRRPRCGRPGRGCASPCRRPTPPSPCRSPRARRSRSRCASRCGLPRPYPCPDYRTGSRRDPCLRFGRRGWLDGGRCRLVRGAGAFRPSMWPRVNTRGSKPG